MFQSSGNSPRDELIGGVWQQATICWLCFSTNGSANSRLFSLSGPGLAWGKPDYCGFFLFGGIRRGFSFLRLVLKMAHFNQTGWPINISFSKSLLQQYFPAPNRENEQSTKYVNALSSVPLLPYASFLLRGLIIETHVASVDELMAQKKYQPWDDGDEEEE